jgi:hypothetical protein
VRKPPFGTLAALRVAAVAVLVVLAFAAQIYLPIPRVPLSQAELKYRLIDQLGKALVCGGMPYPFEPDSAYPKIVADVPTYEAILRHTRIRPILLDERDITRVYVEWLGLSRIKLRLGPLLYSFEFVRADGFRGSAFAGDIDWLGHVWDVHPAAGVYACAICLSPDTVIATPSGDVPVTQVKPGMRVWTAAASGARIDAIVQRTADRVVGADAQLVRLVLADGRTLDVSAGHRTADGRLIGQLKPGDELDGSRVASRSTVAGLAGETFDLLPDGPTATYWANGVLLRSTLAP